MYGSKATCCLLGGHLLSGGLQPASVFAPDSSSSVTALAALSPASKARFLCSAAPNASSPSSCLGPNVTSSQISLHRRPFWRRGKSAFESLPFSRALSVRATQRRQRVLRLSSHPNISISFPFSGDQFCSRIRLCKVLNADANPEVEIEEDDPPNEVNLWTENEMTNDAHHTEESNPREQQQQPNKLQNRVVFGAGIGAVFLGFVLAGGWVFTLAFSCVIWVATGEYFELVRSKGNVARGMIPPPPVAAKVCAAICSLMPIMTLYFGGRMGVVVTTSAFGLAMVLLLQKGPRFSQLTSAIFGLIYCGYLPSFWIKLRCGLNIPALNTRIAAGWPILFGGQAHWTVGLVATIISCSAIAAADTFSFLGGKTFGKTPLIAVSPKKTLEGAVVGLSCTVALTILLSKLFQWPSSTPSAAVLAVLVFMSSLFGDLTESMMKRDAGVKDSGHLIPGHGGILDRVDSYVFTGALVYSFVKIGIPLFGV